jgi:hypothetical protein
MIVFLKFGYLRSDIPVLGRYIVLEVSLMNTSQLSLLAYFWADFANPIALQSYSVSRFILSTHFIISRFSCISVESGYRNLWHANLIRSNVNGGRQPRHDREIIDAIGEPKTIYYRPTSTPRKYTTTSQLSQAEVGGLV